MSPEIKITSENAEHEFHKKLLWYVDEGMSAPSRRQAYLSLFDLLGVPVSTIQGWIIKKQLPPQWRLIISTLEREYGSPPEELMKESRMD